MLGRGIDGGREPTDERLPDGSAARPTRYDLVLAVVPAAFLVGLVATSALSLPPRHALTVAGGVGALALLDALFLNPPRNSERR